LSSLPSTTTNNILVARAKARHASRVIVAHGFHSSSPRLNELPKSPFQTFVEVLKEEIHKNRQLQDNVKQLSGDVDKLQDSEAMRKTREWYERARVCTIIFRWNEWLTLFTVNLVAEGEPSLARSCR
jgi:hypothetical protein